MPDDDEDVPDVAWWGRPQDDPKLHAMLEKARAEFCAAHPPVNCWIDRVQTIDLYQDGMIRAQVERGRSMITCFDEQGSGVSTVIYLCSENPYDVAEAHLGISRVTEIRDESNEAEEPISSWPRDSEDRQAASFRERYGDREDEIFLYLRSAVGALRMEGKSGGNMPDVKPLLDAITAAVLDDYDAALMHARAAAGILEALEMSMFFGRPALADGRRAVVAIERHIAIQRGRPLRRSSTDGKGGG